MNQFLDSFRFDRISFWLGFLAASLFWWLLVRLKPLISQGREELIKRVRLSRKNLASSSESRFRQDILRLAQHQHLANALFSLDEILVIPHLQVPLPPLDPSILPLDEDIQSQTLPELPDWPELAAAYGKRPLSFAEALSNRSNLVITGHPGSGKTVALAYLASQIARQDPGYQELADRLPVFVHVNDLPHLGRRPEDDPFEIMVQAASAHIHSLAGARLVDLLRTSFQSGQAILLLDGLDEYPAAEFHETVNFLGRFIQAYPAIQVVTTAQPDFHPGLPQLGFIPVVLASWDTGQRKDFIRQWTFRWRLVNPISVKEAAGATSLIVDEWLVHDPADHTPLELTLKVWATQAGDLLGSTAEHAIEAHIRRLTASVPKGRLAIEKMAAQMALAQRAYTTGPEAANWIGEFDRAQAMVPSDEPGNPGENEIVEPVGSSSPIAATQEPVTTNRVLPLLAENGLLRSYREGRISLAHPILAGYLAAGGLNTPRGGAQLLSGTADIEGGPPWIGRSLAINYLLARNDAVQFINRYLERDSAPLHLELVTAARWLRSAPENCSWRIHLLRRLASVFQNEALPVTLRARTMVPLALFSGQGAGVLFRQVLSSQNPGSRRLAALGLGLARETKAVEDLERLLTDPDPGVQRAACLALVTIGNQPALDAVASALLNGDGDLRCAAAEALANHSEEGHPILLEGSRLEDPGVRRATIYGLRRIGESWAVETLHKLQKDDEQWVVKNAAVQALEEISQPDLRIPKPNPPLTHTPWLIAFAGERGLGVAPGKAAVDLLLLAMQEGNEDQRLAALDLAGRLVENRAGPIAGEILTLNSGELREMAFTTLWRLSAAGAASPMEAVIRST